MAASSDPGDERHSAAREALALSATAQTAGAIENSHLHWIETLSSHRRWLIGAALVIAVFAVYQPAWRGGYVWDDDEHLLKNPVLQPGGIAKVWVPGAYLNYWPLTYTVYGIEHRLWGVDNPLGFHLVNIAMHCIAALLVWCVLSRLRVPGAWFAAAIFALHPVNVESVVWIAQLKGLLSVVLALASLLFYLGFEERGKWWQYVLAIVVFMLSALAKGEALTLPIVILAIAWWQRGRIQFRDILRVVPFILIGVCMAGVEVWTQHGADVIRTDNIFSRIAIAGCAVWFYLWKLIWPVNLMPFYPRWTVDTWSVLPYLPDIVLLALFGIAWWRRRTWGRPVVMLIVCYVALLLPALGFVNIYFMRYSLVCDHWQYAATIVPCAVFAAACATLAGRFLPRAGAFLATMPILLAIGVLSFFQAHTYAGMEAFWETTLARNPDCWIAHYNFGEFLGGQKKFDAARAQFRAALKIKPDYAKAYYGLGMGHYERNQIDAAADDFRKSVTLDAEDPIAQYYLGLVLQQQGKAEQAIKPYERAVKLDPNYIDARAHLAPLLVQRGNGAIRRGEMSIGIADYEKAVESYPKYPAAQFSLATLLVSRGEFDSAIDHFQQTLKIQPDFEADQQFESCWQCSAKRSASIRTM
jgi:tetratricopeptide (TPR) repeat protein